MVGVVDVLTGHARVWWVWGAAYVGDGGACWWLKDERQDVVGVLRA